MSRKQTLNMAAGSRKINLRVCRQAQPRNLQGKTPFSLRCRGAMAGTDDLRVALLYCSAVAAEMAAPPDRQAASSIPQPVPVELILSPHVRIPAVAVLPEAPNGMRR